MGTDDGTSPYLLADMQKMGIRYPLRESGMGGCVGKGSGTEEMRTFVSIRPSVGVLGMEETKGVVVLYNKINNILEMPR
jgi:hypothetical protein